MSSCCKQDERRLAVLQHPLINGIDYIEVIDRPTDPDNVRQTVLHIYFLKEIQPATITVDNIRILGGERIRNIEVVSATRSDLTVPLTPDASNHLLVVRVDKAGDFSSYLFNLVKSPGEQEPPENFDPVLSSMEFSFKVACPNEFDCKDTIDCNTPNNIEKPHINYLAKDYATLRQLLLDRMALTIPEWKERNPADIGIMLVELLAYAGDYLSYRQDAIATEAYLGTARKRISVKRHARLVDYDMHDGSNAKT